MPKRSSFVGTADADADVNAVDAQLKRSAADLLAQMQTPDAKEGVRRFFRATPAELGRAAVAAARRGQKRRA